MSLLLVLFACVHPVAPDAPPAPPVPEHGGTALAVRDAILFGNLDRARVAFGAVGRSLEVLPDSPARTTAVDVTRRGATASDEATAARTLGELGVACGACHVASGASPSPMLLPEAQGDGVRPEMARHDRALAMAWSGLVRADGAELLAASQALRSSNLSRGARRTPDAAVAMDQAVTAAGDALATAAPADRAERFGALLSACGLCHAVTPDGLDPEPD